VECDRCPSPSSSRVQSEVIDFIAFISNGGEKCDGGSCERRFVLYRFVKKRTKFLIIERLCLRS